MSKQDLTVANTILAQLGGANKLIAMIGAKQFMGGEKDLTFKFGKGAKNGANCVKVTLEEDDTYTVKFYYIRGVDIKEKGETSMVYADNLRRHFEGATGFYLNL